MYISMNDVIEYLGDAVRPLKAGLDLYKSQHVVNAGKSSVNMDIFGQVLQSSNPRGQPHSVKIVGLGNVNNWIATCSCEAGLGHKCKHIFAVLLYVLNSKENLDVLSQTDLEQQWGFTRREKDIQPFDAKLISELCCVRQQQLPKKLSIEVTESNFRRLINAAPESADSLHFERKRKLTDLNDSDIPTKIVTCDDILDRLFNVHSTQNHLQPRILPFMDKFMKDFYFKAIYRDLAGVKEVNRKTIGQSNNLWKLERRKRITASSAYKLFTYSSNKTPDWSTKIADYIKDTKFKSVAMKFGSSTESEAISAYEQSISFTILHLGLVISPILPWFACSVDGYIPELNKIIEVKCPILGQSKDISDVLPTLKYLDGNQCLREQHLYYCQVQLGMAILNATSCDFIVYAKFKKQVKVITIPFNQEMVSKYVQILTNVFFKHMLPTICKR